MKQREFNIQLVIDSEESEFDLLVAELVVDGTVLQAWEHGPLDLLAIEESVTSPGTYFPWTCDCGEPGCAGRFKGVEVAQNEDCVRWADLDMDKEYLFGIASVRKALKTTRQKGKEMLAESRNRKLEAGFNTEFFRESGSECPPPP